MDWNKTFKRITDALTFKTRHRQFINFILDIDEGNVHKVERVLRKYPHFASEKHWATEHLRTNQNPLLQDHGLFNLAVPLERAVLLGSTRTPHPTHHKIVKLLLEKGADPLASRDVHGNETCVDSIIRYAFGRPKELTDPTSALSLILTDILIWIEGRHCLEDVLQEGGNWRRARTEHPELTTQLLQRVEQQKAATSKHTIQSQLTQHETPPTPRRKM